MSVSVRTVEQFQDPRAKPPSGVQRWIFRSAHKTLGASWLVPGGYLHDGAPCKVYGENLLWAFDHLVDPSAV